DGNNQIIISTVSNYKNNFVSQTKKVDNYGTFEIKVYSKTNFESINLVIFNTILIMIITLIFTGSAAMIVRYKNNGKRFELLSYMDKLTGISNRRAFEKKLRDLDKANVNYTVIYLDINNFKNVNDSYGHDTGDVLLQQVAHILNNSLESDIESVSRLGGDEFAFVIPNLVETKEVEARIFRLKTLLNKDYDLGIVELYSTTAIGYAINPIDANYNEKIVKIADDRMYQDKQNYKD
nr:GGDEF domain-containing protein [Acholeplasmatales bacterium]